MKSSLKSRNNRVVDESQHSTAANGAPSRSPSFFKYQASSNSNEERFSREQLKQFVTCTFNDWYYDRTDQWDYKDYFDLLQQGNYHDEFGHYLVENGKNIMTFSNMPFVDLGDKPKSFSPNRPEAEQIFMVPKSEYP